MAVVRQSRHPFSETIAQLLQSITDGGSTVFAVIDQAAAARQAGLIYHLTGPAALARDLAIRAMGPTRMLARQNWIYDWRA